MALDGLWNPGVKKFVCAVFHPGLRPQAVVSQTMLLEVIDAAPDRVLETMNSWVLNFENAEGRVGLAVRHAGQLPQAAARCQQTVQKRMPRCKRRRKQVRFSMGCSARTSRWGNGTVDVKTPKTQCSVEKTVPGNRTAGPFTFGNVLDTGSGITRGLEILVAKIGLEFRGKHPTSSFTGEQPRERVADEPQVHVDRYTRRTQVALYFDLGMCGNICYCGGVG